MLDRIWTLFASVIDLSSSINLEAWDKIKDAPFIL